MEEYLSNKLNEVLPLFVFPNGKVCILSSTAVDTFKSTYLYPAGKRHVGVSEAIYTHTAHSKPSKDGKLRKIRPAYNWLKLGDEHLHPRIDALEARPIRYNWIYATTQ